MPGLTPLDWLVVALYIGGLLALGLHLRKGHHDAEDYYLAGRRAPGWAAGVSVLATQMGAVSLVGAPAFVALADGGGLVWLQYELAVPVAMMVLMVTLVPFLHRRGHVTVYEYLEERFDRGTRRAVSLTFQVSRALATGVAIYALAVVLTVATGWPVGGTILVIGAVTIAYDAMGGMRAVIWSDVAQMAVILVGLAAALAFLLGDGGGWSTLVAAAPLERALTLDMARHGFGDGATLAFLPMLLGGFFLYVSYYGVDQSQAQRILATPDEAAARRTLVLNGVLRFPLVVAYTLLGLLLAGFLATRPDFAATVAAPDFLVPTFLVTYLPVGLRGLLVAAILAAAMSSLDSAINSLSAATQRDLLHPDGGGTLREARWLTVAWGAACTAFAFGAAAASSTVIEAINMVGSLFFGPVLAVFVLGMMTRRVRGGGALAGLAAGLAVNVALAVGAPGVSWLWWNVTGFAAAMVAGLATRGTRVAEHLTWWHGGRAPFGRAWLALAVCFAVVVAVTAALPAWLIPPA